MYIFPDSISNCPRKRSETEDVPWQREQRVEDQSKKHLTERRCGMKLWAADIWEERSPEVDFFLHYLCSNLHKRTWAQTHTEFISFFFRDNPQVIHLKIQHSRKCSGLKRFMSNSAVCNAYNQDRLETIDSLTNPLSAETLM